MGTLLVVDGSDVCRAPIVRFILEQAFTRVDALSATRTISRGVSAERGAIMCENAASRLGFTGPSIAFYGAHRAMPLTTQDVAAADLVLTAERAQRSAVVRMLPGTQATVFTWREALILTGVLLDRTRIDGLGAPSDLPSLARALHGARGTVPIIEPSVRTGVFHWRRSAGADPISIESGHDGRSEHRRITQDSFDVATGLGDRIAGLLQLSDDGLLSPAAPARRIRRSA